MGRVIRGSRSPVTWQPVRIQVGFLVMFVTADTCTAPANPFERVKIINLVYIFDYYNDLLALYKLCEVEIGQGLCIYYVVLHLDNC